MIRDLIILLNVDDFKGESETIDIAKGKYKAPNTFKEVLREVKTKRRWPKK